MCLLAGDQAALFACKLEVLAAGGHSVIMTVSGPMATLVFPERTAPLAVLAASKLADVPLEIKPDAKLGKDAAPTLYFQGG